MTSPLQGTASAANAIDRVKWDHDAAIDLMIGNPHLTQGEIARMLGYTQSWMSRIVNSDAFQARLSQKKSEIIDPAIVLSFEDKLKGLADQSIDIIAEKLDQTKSPDLAYKALELSTKALGYGARKENVQIQQNFVVALPDKAASVESWSAKHNPVPLLAPDQVTDIETT